MNVCIPIRDKQTIIKDWELYHCIQSIRKFTNCEHIFIIGRPRQNPNIPHHKVFWVDYRDRYRAVRPFRGENVRLKILKACHILKEPFLLLNDDIFFMQECDITTIPLYYYKTCEEFAKSKGGSYKDLLLKHPGVNYELHVPMIIQPEVFERATEPLGLYRSLYGRASDLPKQEMKDVKHYGQDGAEYFRDLPFISTSEAHMKTDVKMLIKKVVG